MDDSTLLVSQEQIKSLLDMPLVLSIVERTYRSHGEGKVVLPPKLTLDLGEGKAVAAVSGLHECHAGISGRC